MTNQCRIHFAFGTLLLLVCAATSTHAQPARGTDQSRPAEERRRPPAEGEPQLYDRRVVDQSLANTVVVRIRYKTEYGYKSQYTYGKPGPTSCSAFSVVLAKPARPLRPNYLIPVNRE